MLDKENNEKAVSLSHPAVSVIILGHQSRELLEQAMHSFVLHAMNGQKKCMEWELILILNDPSPEVRSLAKDWLMRNIFPVTIQEIPALRPGAARNHGVRLARAPLLLFLDDDIIVFQDLTVEILRIFSDPLVMAAGGGNLTPPGSSLLERASGYLMGSWWGAHRMRRRYQLGAEDCLGEEALILSNLAVRKVVFEKHGGFRSHLISNEENVLLQDLEANHARLVYSPKLAVYHQRRKTWMALRAQAEKYGSGRAQNILLLPHTAKLLFFLPSVFFLYISSVPLGLLFSPYFLWPLFFYFFISLGFSFFILIVTGDLAALLLPILYPWVHGAYGWGFLKIMLLSLRKRKPLEQVN